MENVILGLRISADQKEALRELANIRGQSMSSITRILLPTPSVLRDMARQYQQQRSLQAI